ncbi:MAG TPA: 4Fe-4S binding protein [Candidatus Thermoplasmatota archaeon]|nr:4Fe-4S binding protein [Candidatus Thermoplasmatota archaeon]
MKFSMIPQVLSQMLKKPFTNKFPAKYIPSSVTGYLKDVQSGKAKMIPPVETPEGFRGKIKYDRDTCIGCKLCMKVCPTDAIEFIPETKKIRIYLSRCCFCSQCNDICPKNCLSMGDEFLLADTDKYSSDLIVE